jgi:hypothetical protein
MPCIQKHKKLDILSTTDNKTHTTDHRQQNTDSMAHHREDNEQGEQGRDGLGRAVLAALDRLEKRMDRLEERLVEASLVTTESSVGPSTSLGNMLEDVLVKLYQVTNLLRLLPHLHALLYAMGRMSSCLLRVVGVMGAN